MPRPAKTVDIVAEMVANAVVLLESMKMEIPVLTELGGTVAAVKVGPGDVVQEGDVLVSIDL